MSNDIPAELEVALAFSQKNEKGCCVTKITLDSAKDIPANQEKGLVVLVPEPIARKISEGTIYWCRLKAMRNANGYIAASAKPYGHTVKIVDSTKRAEVSLLVSAIHDSTDACFTYNPSDEKKSDIDIILETVRASFLWADKPEALATIDTFKSKAKELYKAYRRDIIRQQGKNHKFTKVVSVRT